MAIQLNRSSNLGKLPPGAFARLSGMLDPHGKWKIVAAQITRRSGELMFSQDDIAIIQHTYSSPGHSPTEAVFRAWRTDNATVGQLCDIFLQLELYREAQYITENILHENFKIENDFPEESNAAQSPHQQLQSVDASADDPTHPGQIQTGKQSNNLSELDASPLTSSANNSSAYNLSNASMPVKTLEPSSGNFVTDDNSAMSDADSDSSSASEEPHASISVSDRPVKSTRMFMCNLGTGTYEETTDLKISNAPTVPLEEPGAILTPIDDQPAPEVDFTYIAGRPKQFSYASLRQTTSTFSDDFSLGHGASGSVFRADAHGFQAAVKKLIPPSESELIKKQFTTEVEVLAKCNHENILELIGYSNDNISSWCIVYRYMPNGSVEDRLAESCPTPLSVCQRIRIAKGTARGIHYLHTREPKIIHRDIKSANILLDANWTPKIGDCGIARQVELVGVGTSTVTCCVIGTAPYMPPEYIAQRNVSVKLDAYSYGVVLLELLTGLPVVSQDRDDTFLSYHVREMCADVSEFMPMIDARAGAWAEPVVSDMYRLSLRLLDEKRRRPTVSEVLPSIESWQET
nr:interleukin-1 receptor-associated kinase 4 [Arenicola marina]